jgi:flagellar motility protein MotE (MotC chaperone)
MPSLQARLEQLDQTRRERDDANWRGLVKTYEAMRPRDAAAILNDMDPPVLLQVLDRMKEAKAALVLAAMQPDRARTATDAWLEAEAERPDDVEAADWLRYEQDKHERLLRRELEPA